MKLRQHYLKQIELLLRDEQLGPDEYSSFLDEAIQRFSRDCPLVKTADYAGDGKTYEFSVPADFVPGWSMILALEYPQGERVPRYLAIEDFILYFDATWKFRLLRHVPQTNEKLRCYYTVPHTITRQTSTVDDTDFYALSCLAASLAARALANRYAKHFDSTLPGDIVNYAGKSEIYERLSDRLMNEYKNTIGLGAVSARARWKFRLSTGQDLVTHR